MTTDAMTSPYRGLTPYTEADAAYFFGRTREIAAVAANLEVSRLTVFYGPSGVGKSSVLRAGVIHQLRERAGQNFQSSGNAEIIPIYFNRWQSDPMAGLVQAVEEAMAECGMGSEQWAADPPSAVHRPPSFSAYLREQSERTGSDLLLVLDQFEEYFLYHPDEAGPGSFAHELVAVLTTPDLRVNVLLALREDALARLDRFKGQIPFLLDNRLSIGHLGRAAGEEAIRKPLEQYNQDHGAAVGIEPALVAAVLDQVGSGRVALSRQGAGVRDSVQPQDEREQIEAPYLQLVMTRLWEQEQASQSTILRTATLDSLGGAETIVRNYLDDTLAALDSADQTLAAGFFDRLVTPSGTKIALTLDEIAQYAGGERAMVERLLNRLQDRRLLRGVQSPGGVTQYEIFHDVLGQAILDWQARYRQAQEEAERLAAETEARKEAEHRAEDAEKLRALEEQARSDAQAYSRRLRRLVLGLVALLVLALVAATVAFVQTRLVTGYSLAIQAESYARDDNLRMATLLALEAQRLNPTQGERVLHEEIPYQVPFSYWKPLLGHNDAVFSVAWHPDGQQVASGSEDDTIIVWDGETGEREYTLTGHSDDVRSVAWRPDGRQLASGSNDNTIILWDAETGERVHLLAAHDSSVTSVAWSPPDGRQLASGSNDGTIIIWDAETGEWVQRLFHSPGDSSGVASVAWRPDGRQLAAGSDDSTIIIWDVETGEPVRTLTGHSDGVTSVAWRPDGRQLASGSWDNTIIIWDAETGAPVRTVTEHNDSILSVTWRPDGQQLASGSADDTIIVRDAETGAPVRTLTGHSDAVWSVAWRPDGEQLASGSEDATVIVWNAEAGEQARTLTGHGDRVLSVAWRPDGQQIASGSSDNTIIVWDAEVGERVRMLTGHDDGVTSVTWRPDGHQLASGSLDNTIIVWDAEAREQAYALTGHSDDVTSVMWSPDGHQLASGSLDNTIIVWDAETGELVLMLSGHGAPVTSIAWRPDGQQLASGSSDGTVIVWDAQTGAPVHTLTAHSAAVLSVAWRLDGRQIVSGSRDGTSIVWDAETGEQVHTLAEHRDSVTSVMWSPDGRQVASGSDDKTLITFPVAYMESPCEWARSNLSVDEWIDFRGRALYQPSCPDYPSQPVPAIRELLHPYSLEYLFLTVQGQLFVVGALLFLLAIMVLLIWGVFRLAQRFLRRRRARPAA